MSTVRISMLAITVITGALLGGLTYAQTTPQYAPALNIATTPSSPAPGDTVTVSIESHSIDLQRSNITWYVDGVEHDQGPGMTSIQIPAGSSGTQTTVTAQAGATGASAQTHIRPSNISVIWEADSYTPPFYKGRALPTHGSRVRAAAMVEFIDNAGTRIPETDIIFTWKLNGRVLGNLSGRGQSSVTIQGPGAVGESVLTVEAESLDYAHRAEATTLITGTEPQLILYPDYPAGGIAYHTALTSNAEVSDSEFTVTAAPYYMSATRPSDRRLRYTWTVNGSEVSTDDADASRITLGVENQSGVAHVELSATHRSNLLQKAQRQWTLELFGDDAPRNPFRRSVEVN